MDDFPEFRVSQRRVRDSVVVRPEGEVDIATVDELRAAINAAREQTGQVVLDLRGVSFMDSHGLGLIVWVDREARRDGFSLSVIPGPPAVGRLLEVAGLTARLTLIEDLAQVGGDDGEPGA